MKKRINQSVAGKLRKRRRRQQRSHLAFEALEPKNLLATISFDASAGLLTFDADAGQADIVSVSSPAAGTLQILVGGGDDIVLAGDASGNAAFALGQTNSANDTLQVDVGTVTINELVFNLGDQDDSFTATGITGVGSLFVTGQAGADTIDVQALNAGVALAGGAGNDTLIGGSGNDVLAGGGGTDVIIGGAGNDTNSFQGIAIGVVATVAADGTGNATYGNVNETFTGIENLTGSDSSDVLTATGAAANVLRGEGGNDILAGGGGTDIIDGGIGNDTNSFQGIGFGVIATVAADGTGTAEYGPVSETFTGIENLTGSDNDDVLTATGAAANVLLGQGGNDILAGGGGTDIIDGGTGTDTNSFQGIGFGVIATVAADGTGTAEYGPVTETFAGIENLTGSENDDVLTATGAAANVLLGQGGNDILAGGGGTDIIDGGDGIDTNSFAGIGVGVTAIITADSTGTAVYGTVNEAFVSIENLTGSDNADNLTGNFLVNVIDGGAGNDLITGSGGDDILTGGAGSDTIRGNAGADLINGGSGNDILNGGTGNDTIFGGFGNDLLTGIQGTDSIDGGDGIDTNSFQGIGLGVTATVLASGSGTAVYGNISESFTNIENLTGSDNDDVLTGVGSVSRVLRGGSGDDTLTGGSADDVLFGDTGNDLLRGAGGNDSIFGGAGADSLNGGGGNDTLRGEFGDDFLVGIGGQDLIIGGEGIDTNSFQGIGFGVNATLNNSGSGTAQYGLVNEQFFGIESLVGSSNDDVLVANGVTGRTILGLDGNDLILGSFGDDFLVGGNGDDTIQGRAGADTLLGDAGSDTLIGGAGNDRIGGGGGDDFLFGNAGLDLIFGGFGQDSLFGAEGEDELRGGGGNDLLVGGLGIDLLIGGPGEDQEIQ